MFVICSHGIPDKDVREKKSAKWKIVPCPDESSPTEIAHCHVRFLAATLK
jgi:hypothetical protein